MNRFETYVAGRHFSRRSDPILSAKKKMGGLMDPLKAGRSDIHFHPPPKKTQGTQWRSFFDFR